MKLFGVLIIGNGTLANKHFSINPQAFNCCSANFAPSALARILSKAHSRVVVKSLQKGE